MSVPEYLDTDLFNSVVHRGFNLSDFNIVSSNVEIATSPGDNYTSTIHRIHLNIVNSKGNVKEIQFLVKHLTDLENGAKLVEFMDVYEKEIEMMKNIVPRLTKIAKGIQFAAKFYYSLPVKKNKILAMEDLKELHFRMADRREALDYDHCCIALRKLGQMHAASMCLAEQDPSLMDKFSFGICHGSMEAPGQMQQCLSWNFPTLCEVIKTWEGFEDISQKLERIKEHFWPLVYEGVSRMKNSSYQVLNHGDFWTNNFLYKYNETTGKPIDILFVDLQQSWYTTPAHDLYYFLSTSPQIFVREHQREDLLQCYYDSFSTLLTELRYQNIPTFEDFQEEMRKNEIFGFLGALFILPLALMEEQTPQGSGIDGLIDSEAGREMSRIMFYGKRYAEAIKPILRRCDQLKLFDF